MSGIFYLLLTNTKQWNDVGKNKNQVPEMVKKGKRPPIPEHIQSSSHPVHKAFLHILKMTQFHEPTQRATAKEVESYLRQTLIKLNISQYQTHQT